MRPTHIHRIAGTEIRFFTDSNLSALSRIMPGRRFILIADQNLYKHHRTNFSKWDTIVLRAGEQYKVQATVDSLIERLTRLEADRTTVLVGVGGGGCSGQRLPDRAADLAELARELGPGVAALRHQPEAGDRDTEVVGNGQRVQLIGLRHGGGQHRGKAHRHG